MKVKQMFSRLFSTADALESEPAEQLYRSVLQASRTPEFYLKFDVPDSLDGRFVSIEPRRLANFVLRVSRFAGFL